MSTKNNTSSYISVEDFEQFLLDELEASNNKNALYLQTRKVAEQLDLTTHQVGQAFTRHRSRSEHFDIERWSKTGKSSGAKWYVEMRTIARQPQGFTCPRCGSTYETHDVFYGHLGQHMNPGGTPTHEVYSERIRKEYSEQ